MISGWSSKTLILIVCASSLFFFWQGRGGASSAWVEVELPKGVKSIRNPVECKSDLFVLAYTKDEERLYKRKKDNWQLINVVFPHLEICRLFCYDGILLMIHNPFQAGGAYKLSRLDEGHDVWVPILSPWSRIYIALHPNSNKPIDEQTWTYPKAPYKYHDAKSLIKSDNGVYLTTWNHGVFTLLGDRWEPVKGLPKKCIVNDFTRERGELFVLCAKSYPSPQEYSKIIGIYRYLLNSHQWQPIGYPGREIWISDLLTLGLVLSDYNLYLISTYDREKSRIYKYHLKK